MTQGRSITMIRKTMLKVCQMQLQLWKIATDHGKVVGVIFLDFHKAFDAVSHPVLMEKIEKTGIREALYNWILDYLTNRYQYTEVNGVKLRIRIVEYGVPQGSLLGPRLFKIYVNDLLESVDEGIIYLFTDNTTVYYIGNSIEDVLDGLNQIGEDLNQWSVRNELCINSETTEVMTISLRPFIGPLRPLHYRNPKLLSS